MGIAILKLKGINMNKEQFESKVKEIINANGLNEESVIELSWKDCNERTEEDKKVIELFKDIVDEFVKDEIDENEFIFDEVFEYGEPGYELQECKNSILFGNWNEIDNLLFDVISFFYELEWYDEWVTDYNECKAYRSSPNGWGWQPSYFIYDSEILPIKGNEELYIEDKINNCHSIVDYDIDLSKLGFTELEEDKCSGWYSHCTDPCRFVEDNLTEEALKRIDFVFKTESKGQFSINWSFWIKPKDENDKEVIDGILSEYKEYID